MQFQAETENGNLTIFLNGRLTFADHQVFTEMIESVKANAPKKVNADLSNLDSVDSAGLGMFILLRDLSMSLDVSLVFRGAKGQVLKMLELSEFQSVLTLEP